MPPPDSRTRPDGARPESAGRPVKQDQRSAPPACACDDLPDRIDLPEPACCRHARRVDARRRVQALERLWRQRAEIARWWEAAA